MDASALLDLLGNGNRRRILRLLSRKPCYVTETSEYLGVSPKAVIDHLRKLEEAGLVESRVDSQRRKYFSIARNLRLEVSVSPYSFGTKSAYPASRGFDMPCCRYLSLHMTVDPETEREDVNRDGDLAALASELAQLEGLENELSMAQRWVQGRLTDVMDDLSDRFDDIGGMDGRFYAEVAAVVANGISTPERIARKIDASPEVVDDALRLLAEHEVIVRTDDGWRLVGAEE